MEEGYYRSSQEDFHKGHYQHVLKQSGGMDSPEFSMLSSLRGESSSDDYIQPHYRESYRLAIDRLVEDGQGSYHEFLKKEHLGSFLSGDELLFITANVKHLQPQNHAEEVVAPSDSQSSSGTYWPTHSDVQTPNLDLGWPEVLPENLHTNINLLFHPPRLNNPTIKEVIRKYILDARKVIGIVMDVFTDVDIFRETVDASLRGVPVYVLLDHLHLKSFLKMAEEQDIKLQQLRNMRVRTVKGQDYLCRSGAKFHGAMKQKFLVVDCHTAIYGSYSFAWSFEKINLSMVQVIKGHLVKSYDEEFRTLFAQSTVPAELSPPEGLFHKNGLHMEKLLLPKSYSAPKLGRRDQMRYSLDVANRKTCERKFGTRDLKDEGNMLGPLIENDVNIHHQMLQFPQIESAESINCLKRHSYAGERQDGQTSHNTRPRGSYWNISRDTGAGPNNYSMDVQVPQIHRGQNMRKSYNGNDKQVFSMQQDIPTLENTSKAFMRTWRIDTYLKNSDAHALDAGDYLDQFETPDRANPFMQGRMRTSLVLRSTIPEQIEPNRHINNTSTVAGLSAAPNSPLHYSSMQWNPTMAENRLNSHEFTVKRQSLQILDDVQYNPGYGPGRNSYQSAYTSLGRTQHRQIIRSPDILTDDWQKRHSLADPRSSTEPMREPPALTYVPFIRTPLNKSSAEISALNGGYRSNLSEDQRSISHYDVMSITDTKGSSNPIWQEPPSRSVSAAALDLKNKDVANKSNSSHHLLKGNSKKSLMNILEKKGETNKSRNTTPSLASDESTDTITAEDETEKSRDRKGQPSRSSSFKFYSKYSKPRFKTEEHQLPSQNSVTKTSIQKKPSILERKSSKPGAENHLQSRFEPFCSFEKKTSLPTMGLRRTRSEDKSKNSSKGEAADEDSLTRAPRGQHENRLEKFFQRVGHFIHKNK